MTAWLIVFGILLFFALLLHLPIYVKLYFQETFQITIRFLFFSFPILPGKEKPEKAPRRKRKRKKSREEEQTPEEEKAPPWWKQLYNERGFSGILRFFAGLGRIASTAAKKIFRHAYIKRFVLTVITGGEDAAAVALDYGKACGVIYPAAALLARLCRGKRPQVSVLPNFQAGQTKAELELVMRFRGFWLLTSAGGALLRFLWMQMKEGKTAAISEQNAV